MAFQPADTLKSRTYLGLIGAQFLAAFNDQCIHASAMFYAIHNHTLTQDRAISLMPILFFAPWAIFCTLAGWLADRYSKRNSLVFWKVAEIVITVVALAGFWVGTVLHHPDIGTWIVLSTVFLMGTHSAFFVPAKYGVMPEILQPTLLSRGNGILESTSFLAVILGTVSGGILSWVFQGQEYYIGVILVVLAILGAIASLLIQHMPPANPTRPFPTNLVKPLFDNLRTMLRSRPLALSILGIAFFTFMVAFMRATMYMHGESQIPRWNEFETSVVVATVALGVGLGSPLAGWLSGGKIELGLVPLGAVGMILATLVAALTLAEVPALIVCLVLIGFFSGFYIVPLYTLLQHRAPKTSKGDLIATSNFINVTGAICASLLFFSLVWAAKLAGIAREVPQVDVVEGILIVKERYPSGHPAFVEVQPASGEPFKIGRHPRQSGQPAPAPPRLKRRAGLPVLIQLHGDLREGEPVAVSRWTERPHGVEHFEVRPAGAELRPAYDQEDVPVFLFIGASLMTLGVLIVLCIQLPDFFVRTLVWLRAQRRYRLRVIGLHNLPSDGPVILATNCGRFDECMQVVSATDRFTRFILLEDSMDEPPPKLLSYLTRRTGLVQLPAGAIPPEAWDAALEQAAQALRAGHLVGLSIGGTRPEAEVDRFLDELRTRAPAKVLPVYSSSRPKGEEERMQRVRIVIGRPLPPDASAREIRTAMHILGKWLHEMERSGRVPTTVMIPEAAAASPPAPEAGLPAHP